MDLMRTPPQGEATPPFNIADHLIILTPDAPTRLRGELSTFWAGRRRRRA
jgi:hypothetical protein